MFLPNLIQKVTLWLHFKNCLTNLISMKTLIKKYLKLGDNFYDERAASLGFSFFIVLFSLIITTDNKQEFVIDKFLYIYLVLSVASMMVIYIFLSLRKIITDKSDFNLKAYTGLYLLHSILIPLAIGVVIYFFEILEYLIDLYPAINA